MTDESPSELPQKAQNYFRIYLRKTCSNQEPVLGLRTNNFNDVFFPL